MDVDQKLIAELKAWFQQFSGTIVAFSGGIDSALVLFLSRKHLGKENTIGVISNSESLKNKDYQLALDFAKKNDIQLKTVQTKELSDSDYNSNPFNRCYFCKTHLYAALDSVKKMYPEFMILNGTNKDDFSDYRPGMRAADENNVRSPLADLGIGKSQIRDLAKHFEIPFWNKPASPCLSSRIPYGNKVTAIKLNQIEEAESVLNGFGFNDIRARHYGKSCRIEVPLSQFELFSQHSKEITLRILEIGFEECVLDKEGLISGKLNNALNLING